MQVATGIWTQHAAGHALAGARPAPLAGPANGNTGSSDDSDDSSSATISANDFLTLLVTEMQNQDPTDDTDPNEYIDQLVEVNSLEQLIDINQNLSTVLGISDGSSTEGSASASSANVSPQAAGLAPSTSGGAPAIVHAAASRTSALGQVQSAAATRAAAHSAAVHGKSVGSSIQGNLSVPQAKPAARRVAHALAGRTATH